MITKIDKPVDQLKIGLLGFRYYCFSTVLDKHNISYEILHDVSQIDESFDIIFESGVYYIIPDEILQKPTYGFVGVHESPMPEGRGHAPIQWSVLNNRDNLVISLYRLTKGVDAGDIIMQYNVGISDTDTLEILEVKRQQGITECFDQFLDELKQGIIVHRKQSGAGSYHNKRTPADSELDIDKSLGELWNLIRVCDNDNFPAYFMIGDTKVILRYEVVDDTV